MKYKPLKLVQRSPEWLEWRNGGIGASEIGIIMGSLPFEYGNVTDLWKEKVSLADDFQMTDAVQLGIDLEPTAAKYYTRATGFRIRAKCFTHPTQPYINASLDGYNAKRKKGVEIKCPGIGKFYYVKRGGMSGSNYAQVQQQMYCTNLDEMDFWVFREDEGGVLVRVARNQEYIEEIKTRGEIFWDLVQKRIPARDTHFGLDYNKKLVPFKAGNMETTLVRYFSKEELENSKNFIL